MYGVHIGAGAGCYMVSVIRRTGFSLLELVVVLAFMGTLAAVAVPVLGTVTDNSSAGALQSSVDGLIKAANGKAQSDVENPGRGMTINDIDISGYPNARLDQARQTVTIFGQKDQCIQISVTGTKSEARLVKSSVKESRSVMKNESTGKVTSGTCS